MKKLNYSAIFTSKNVLLYITILVFVLRFIIDYYKLDYIVMLQVLGGIAIYYMLHFFYKKEEYNFITIFTAIILVVMSKLSFDHSIVISEKKEWEKIQHYFNQNKDSIQEKNIQL